MTSQTQRTVAVDVRGGAIQIDGEPVPHSGEGSLYEAAVAEVARRVAGPAGVAVEAIATDDSGSTRMTIHPDGRATDVAPVDGSTSGGLDALMDGPSDHARSTSREMSQVSSDERSMALANRPSFITAGRTIEPANKGWRGGLNKLGLRLGPGPKEQSERDDVDAVSRHWPGTLTVAVANQKGGANKTPTVACLSAAFARNGGAGVLAWDNNETEGTLTYRTEWATHEATMLHLLDRAELLLAPTAAVAEMSQVVHHQPADKYDVLWSDQSVNGNHVVSAEDVELIHRVASRYYRMIIMDSGNSNRAPNWRAMVKHADALVVPCTNGEDTAEKGARLLETLTARGGHSADLASRALVVVSERSKNGKNMRRIVEGFENLGARVVTIPYDSALETGVIRFDALRPVTQRAWLRAAAALTEAL